MEGAGRRTIHYDLLSFVPKCLLLLGHAHPRLTMEREGLPATERDEEEKKNKKKKKNNNNKKRGWGGGGGMEDAVLVCSRLFK